MDREKMIKELMEEVKNNIDKAKETYLKQLNNYDDNWLIQHYKKYIAMEV